MLNFSGGTLQASASFSGSLAMTLGTAGSGGGATFNTAGYQVTLTAPLSGAGGFTEVGSGTLILAATNTFSGNTLISSGTLALRSALALQQSTLDTRGSGTLSFGTLTAATFGGLAGLGTLNLSNTAHSAVAFSVGNNNASTTFSGTLYGAGSLIKIGSGTLDLTGAESYSGTTAINQGELLVNGSLVSPVSVNSGGTLGGAGNLTSVTVNAGAHLAPGNFNTGTLILGGSLDFEGGEFDIAGAGSSLTGLSIAGNLILDNAPTLIFSGSLAPGTYTIASYGGTLSGQFAAPNLPAGDTINYGTGSSSSITLTAVPEPGTLVLLAGGALGLLVYGWKKRKLEGLAPTIP
jgi:autotransporter-associated beta strand protein